MERSLKHNFETTWKSGTKYNVGDEVLVYGRLYRATEEHLAEVFADQFHGKNTPKKTVKPVWKIV